jgi:endonuclease/exonuclease/phosphatase family metal-dependent hydrolase
VKYFNFIVALLLSLVYVSGDIPPSKGFNLWVTSFVIPVALAINHLLLIISLLMKKKSSVFYVIALLIGSPYLTSTFGVKHLIKRENTDSTRFSVVSYNVGVFSMRPHYYKNRDSARIALKNWILSSDGDVKCIQEFANIGWSKQFNLVRQLRESGLHFYFSTDNHGPEREHFKNGTLIISKYPIVRHDDVLVSKNGFNRIAYADVVVNRDTIRIVNVHLESMGLTELHPTNAQDLSRLKTQIYTILRKLKVGVFERSNQIRELSEFIAQSPYPVICAGDFNDLPYSYNYRYMKKRMKNSFEESGKGLGFTYNGSTLKMLRIDNQFYTRGVSSVGFQTLDSVKFSDHFPIRAEYILTEAGRK